MQGYTERNQSALDLVNEGKVLEERVLRYIEKVELYSNRVSENPGELGQRLRFMAAGRTQIQFGFMGVFRAVFNPQRISLPTEESQ